MNNTIIDRIAHLTASRFDRGFSPDADTIHFLRTSYSIESPDDLLKFLDDSTLNDGTIYELAIYPDDEFRLDIEKLITLTGLKHSEIETLNRSITSLSPEIHLITPAGKFFPDTESRVSSIISFIKKLNLDLDFQYIGDPESSTLPDFYFAARALLRKRKFIPCGDRGNFMKILINSLPKSETVLKKMLALTDRAATLLNGREDKSLDALAIKKYYYESVISQAEEFASMLKTYSMEFLMLKKIQPPPVSIDDAIESIQIINRLTSTVYGTIIPASDISVQFSINCEDSPSGIFD